MLAIVTELHTQILKVLKFLFKIDLALYTITCLVPISLY